MTHMSTLQNGFAGKLMEVLDHVEYRRIESRDRKTSCRERVLMPV